MDGHQPARHHDAELFFDEELILPPKFARALRVPHVAVAVGICEQRLKRRRKHREAHAIRWQALRHLYRVGMVDRILVSNYLIYYVHSTSPFYARPLAGLMVTASHQSSLPPTLPAWWQCA